MRQSRSRRRVPNWSALIICSEHASLETSPVLGGTVRWSDSDPHSAVVSGPLELGRLAMLDGRLDPPEFLEASHRAADATRAVERRTESAQHSGFARNLPAVELQHRQRVWRQMLVDNVDNLAQRFDESATFGSPGRGTREQFLQGSPAEG